MWIEIPTRETCSQRQALVSETNDQIKLSDCDKWIQAGVACFCALRF